MNNEHCNSVYAKAIAVIIVYFVATAYTSYAVYFILLFSERFRLQRMDKGEKIDS